MLNNDSVVYVIMLPMIFLFIGHCVSLLQDKRYVSFNFFLSLALWFARDTIIRVNINDDTVVIPLPENQWFVTFLLTDLVFTLASLYVLIAFIFYSLNHEIYTTIMSFLSSEYSREELEKKLKEHLKKENSK